MIILKVGDIMNIRDLRMEEGLTQREFSERYGIPLPTLRHWEQNVSSPPPYYIALLSQMLSGSSEPTIKLEGKNKESYHYCAETSELSDSAGNKIVASNELLKVKKENLSLYLTELFTSIDAALERFERLCIRDQESDILWIER